MNTQLFQNLVIDGKFIPFIGIGIFKEVDMPYSSDSLILAMNNGRAMPPRLMYEYSRAAMNLEQKKGRGYLEELIKSIYAKAYEMPTIYKLISQNPPPYIIDTNVDDSLQKAYAHIPHFLILGRSRVLGDGERFVVYVYDTSSGYTLIESKLLDDSKPILFKPMGSISPELNLIVSDADFVDWLTEAMGGYGVPKFLKAYRKEKRYCYIGMDFGKDTFRMVANEITMDSLDGVVLENKEEFTKKELSFFEKHQIEVVKYEES